MKKKLIKAIQQLDATASLEGYTEDGRLIQLELLMADGKWKLIRLDGQTVTSGKLSKRGLEQLSAVLDREKFLVDNATGLH